MQMLLETRLGEMSLKAMSFYTVGLREPLPKPYTLQVSVEEEELTSRLSTSLQFAKLLPYVWAKMQVFELLILLGIILKTGAKKNPW